MKAFALFMDCDMLVLDDICQLSLNGADKAVWCVQHDDYTPKSSDLEVSRAKADRVF